MVASKEWVKSLLKKAKEKNLFIDNLDSFVQNIINTYGDERLFYKKGETITINNTVVPSMISNSNKDLYFTIPLRKRLDKISTITCTACKANVYKPAGGTLFGSYVSGGYDILSMSGVTFTIVKTNNTTVLRFKVTFSGGIYGGTNNSQYISDVNKIVLKLS